MTAMSTPSNRRRAVSLGLLALVAAPAILFRRSLLGWFEGPRDAESEHPGAAATSRDIDHYTCSMHPSVHQAGPGKCPICSMDLVPVSKAQQAEGVVLIDDARRQLIGVRTAPVVEAPLRSSFQAVGRVTYDESALTDVNLKVRGFITKLFVNETGQHVTRGQALFTLYSPDLYAAEEDFLLASRASAFGSVSDAGTPRSPAFAHAARKRLNLMGLSEAQIDAIAAQGEPQENTLVSSPAAGFVIEKNVVEGASVDAGMRLFRIAALNKVWVEADIYEADLARVRVGQAAKVTLDYLPGESFDARIAYVYPYLEAGARTGRVRIELANRSLELKPGMYAHVEVASDSASRLQVPASAIVYTGPRRLVFVGLGQGRFRPQEVRIGSEADGMFEVLSGLHAGDIVATSGVFLIAAEARISTAATYWNSEVPASATTMPAAPALPAMPTSMPPSTQAPFRMPARAATSAATPPARLPAARGEYTCPMHPAIKHAGPGKCPICGMDMQPVGGAYP